MTILFASGFESGDFRDFDIVSISGLTSHSVQQNIVHSGLYAAKLTIMPLPFLPRPGVRLAWQNKDACAPDDPQNLPDAAYYSAWYFLPRAVQTSGLNLMQWKQPRITGEDEQTRDPVFNVQLRGDKSRMLLTLRDRVDETGQYYAQGRSAAWDTVQVPVAEWFQLKTLYVWDTEPQGRVMTTLNERILWNVTGIRTEFDRPSLAYARQVTWNNYAGDVKPNPYTLYIDDVRVEAA